MPLHEDIKGGHGEGEPGVEVLPDAVHDFLAMAHDGQHGEHRLDEHPALPRAARTQFEVRRVPLGGMEGSITQDDHAAVDLPNQPLKGIIGDIGRGTVPPYHQAILVSLNLSQFVAHKHWGRRCASPRRFSANLLEIGESQRWLLTSLPPTLTFYKLL